MENLEPNDSEMILERERVQTVQSQRLKTLSLPLKHTHVYIPVFVSLCISLFSPASALLLLCFFFLALFSVFLPIQSLSLILFNGDLKHSHENVSYEIWRRFWTSFFLQEPRRFSCFSIQTHKKNSMSTKAFLYYYFHEDRRGQPDGWAQLPKRSFGCRCMFIFFVFLFFIFPFIFWGVKKKKKGYLCCFLIGF